MLLSEARPLLKSWVKEENIMANLKVKLVKGLAGKKKDQIAIVASLGLKKTGDVSVQPDNEATRGKIFKISHLVEVTEE